MKFARLNVKLVFFPEHMGLRCLPEEKLRDPSTTFLDPSCGDGNFLYALHEVLTQDYGHTSESVMDRLYGVELMEDNVAEAKRRLPGAS